MIQASLRTRLFAAIVLIVLLSVGIALVIGALLTRRAVERSAQRNLARQTDLLAERERASLLAFSRLKAVESALAAQGERIAVVNLGVSSPFLPDEARAEVRAGREAQGRVVVDGTEYFYAARLVSRRALVILRPTSLSAQASRPYLQGLGIAALTGALLAALVSLLLARAIARPVRRVAAASRALGQERSPPAVPVEGPPEVAALARSFNEMAVQLSRAREAERNFLLSVSHELKTPLTAIRGYAEALAEGAVPPDEAAETVAREASRLERLVQDLLDLARMNKSEFTIRREVIDLGEAAQQAASRHEVQARAFDVALEAVAEGEAPAIGDADRMLQVVSNLVENALRVTPPGGRVRVVATPGSLVVEDDGPGLKPDELARAFDRFFLWSRYGSERRVGTGLGLAIVKELVEGMGGSVAVESEPGRGARFTVRLPVPRDAERVPDAELAHA